MFAPVKTIRVVVADDSAPIRQRLLALLGENKSLAVVGEAKDADSTLDTVQQLEPDALVLDLAMPGGGGLAVLRALRERERPPVVVVISNYATTDYRAKHWVLWPFSTSPRSSRGWARWSWPRWRRSGLHWRRRCS